MPLPYRFGVRTVPCKAHANQQGHRDGNALPPYQRMGLAKVVRKGAIDNNAPRDDQRASQQQQHRPTQKKRHAASVQGRWKVAQEHLCAKARYNKQMTLKLDTVVIRNRAHLLREIDDLRKIQFPDWNHLDVSQLEDFSEVLKGDGFIGDISKWNMSKAKTLENMFMDSSFNGDISRWDVSNVRCMDGVFHHCAFEGDLSNWDTSNVDSMERTFANSKFNGDLSRWNVSRVENMRGTFAFSMFNRPLSTWRTSRVTTMEGMFRSSKFNQDIGAWDVSNVGNLRRMFNHSSFDSDISKWDVRKSHYFAYMFEGAPFKGDLSAWAIAPTSHMTGMLDRSALSMMGEPCLYHWVDALLHPTDTMLSGEALQHFQEHVYMADSLGMDMLECADTMRALWHKRHLAPAALDVLSLPIMDLP